MFKINQWIRAGDYEIIVHALEEQFLAPRGQGESPEIVMPDGTIIPAAPDPHAKRVIYLDVGYRNKSKKKNLSCRRNQWYLFDTDGYSYEAEGSNDYLYYHQQKQFLGGERFLNPDFKLRGWVAFLIPPTAVIERVQFVSGFLASKTADIAI